MTARHRLWTHGWFVALPMLLATAAASAGNPAGAGHQPDARCAVWARELGFAQSVAQHDAAAFSGFLHEDAVFGVGSEPNRGRDAITAQWKPIIDGSGVELRWYPDKVAVGGDGRTAYSSGPALYRNPRDGSYRLGRFGSVWQQGGDGQWRVIFDDGIRPVATDAAGAEAFEAGRQPDCPAG